MELKRKFSQYSLENKFYWQLQFVNAIRVLELKAVCTDNHVLDFDRAWIQLYSLPNELLNETY